MKEKIGFVAVILVSLIVMTGCQKKIAVSDAISFSYTGYFSDGVLFETGEKDIIIGSGEVPKFMEDAMIDKKRNESVKLKVTPENAYGPLYDSGKLQKIPKFVFEKIFSGFVIGEKKQFSDIEGIVKGTEMMEGTEYVLFEMNPRQTWDVLDYEIQILDK